MAIQPPAINTDQDPGIATGTPAITVASTQAVVNPDGTLNSTGTVPFVAGATELNNTVVTVTGSTTTVDSGDNVVVVTTDRNVYVTVNEDNVDQNFITNNVNNVGGSDTEIQYNDAGNFAGDSTFTFDKVTKVVAASAVSTDNLLYANGDPWTFGGGGNTTPGGLNGQLQFNDAGSFNGVPGTGYAGGKLSLGSNAALGITGGAAGQMLTTDGAGNLSWSTPAGTYGNSNVASYLPTYTGNIGANYITAAYDVNANVVDANYLYGDGSNITNIAYAESANTANVAGSASSVAGINVSGTVANANYAAFANIAEFANNVAVEAVNNNFSYHVVLTTGPGDTTLHNDVDDSFQYNPADGILTVTRVDATYFVGDLAFAHGLPAANVTGLGNLATINTNGNGQTWLSGNGTFANIAVPTVGNIAALNLDGSSNNVLYGNGVFAPVAGGNATLPIANGTSNIDIAAANGNVTITANASNTWTFGDDGLLSLPGGFTKIGAQYGSEAIFASNVSFGVATQGANVTTFMNWSDDVANTSVMAAIYVNAPNANPGDIHFRTGNVGTPNIWKFNVDGNLVLPNGNSVIFSTANSSLDPLNPNVSTMTLTPDANYSSQVLVLDPTAVGHIHLRAHASSNIDEPAANIFLGGENTSFEVTSGSNNQARIHSGGNTWTFNNDGNLQVAGDVFANTGASPAPALYGFSSLQVYDSINVGGVTINSTDGTNGQVLTTYGNGVTYWSTVSGGGGTPAGSNNQIQFNSNGAFAASGNYTFSDTVGGGTVTVGNELVLLGNGTIGTANSNLNIQPAGNLLVTASAYNWTFDTAGNLTLPGNTFSVNYANGSQASAPLVDITSTNGLTTVYYPTFVEDRTTGQIVRADQDLSYRTDTNTLTVGNITVNSQSTLIGNSTTGANAVIAGTTNTILPNSVAAFSANVNNYTQVTLQNKSTGADATADFVATADNGSDTVNYLDLGIINSGYDNNTPTNSLGNIVFAADSYLYAQGNVSNTSQAGGNLAIGTTVAGKTVKIFAGGANSNSIVANIANTGIAVTGNLSVSGNITGNTAGFAIGYRDIPQVAASNATIGLSDAGKHFYSTTAGNLTLTIPLNSTTAFPTGTAINIVVQAAGNVLVNAASGVTLYLAGNSTAANRVVGTYGMATLLKVATDTWFINGTGVS